MGRALSVAVAALVALAALVAMTAWLRPPGTEPTAVAGLGDAGDPLRSPQDCPAPVAEEDRMQPGAGGVTVATQVRSHDLVQCPRSWDGRAVVYRGEVVGPVLRRGHVAWLQVNDDPYGDPEIGPLPASRTYVGRNTGIGVLAPAASADRVGAVGGPDRRGDLVVVEGVFHRVHADTREVAVVVADRVLVELAGEAMRRPTDGRLPVVALLAAAAASTLVVAERRSARR